MLYVKREHGESLCHLYKTQQKARYHLQPCRKLSGSFSSPAKAVLSQGEVHNEVSFTGLCLHQQDSLLLSILCSCLYGSFRFRKSQPRNLAATAYCLLPKDQPKALLNHVSETGQQAFEKFSKSSPYPASFCCWIDTYLTRNQLLHSLTTNIQLKELQRIWTKDAGFCFCLCLWFVRQIWPRHYLSQCSTVHFYKTDMIYTNKCK